MKSFKTNIYLKIAAIVIIALLLLIPASMIKNMIREREITQTEAIKEVSSKWGEAQTIDGPFISIPYYKYIKEYSQKESVEKIIKVTEYIHFLPTNLKIDGNIFPERRYRGIYEIVVYNSKLNFVGEFNEMNFSDLDIPIQDIQFDKATISVGINDLRGIKKQIALKWNNDCELFNPGVSINENLSSGINSKVKITNNDSTSYKFSFELDLKGSQQLYFVPVGKVTDVKLHSTWNNPSFNGTFLPDTRNVTDSGFYANWNILNLNRNFPQRWIGNNQNTISSAFGIDLILPVDNYQKSTRSIKYAILFIAFTFLVFFFVEIKNSIFIHPVQYILVGIALIIFYTLLLSISEQLSFNLAFAISAVATLLLISWYVKTIIKSNAITALIGSVLFILYSFIFVIIQLQDYALLIGSIGIFIILAIVMYFSRDIDWYNVSIGEKNKIGFNN
jgi:inner membrane protein